MIPNGNHDSGLQSCGTGVIGRRGSVTQEGRQVRAMPGHKYHTSRMVRASWAGSYLPGRGWVTGLPATERIIKITRRGLRVFCALRSPATTGQAAEVVPVAGCRRDCRGFGGSLRSCSSYWRTRSIAMATTACSISIGVRFFDDLLDLGIGVGREDAIRQTGLQIGQQRFADPGLRIARHALGQRPEQIAPRHHLAEHRLVAAEFVATGRVQRLCDEPANKVELDGKPCAALKAKPVQKPGTRIKAQDLFRVAVDRTFSRGVSKLLAGCKVLAAVKIRRRLKIFAEPRPSRAAFAALVLAAGQRRPIRPAELWFCAS